MRPIVRKKALFAAAAVCAIGAAIAVAALYPRGDVPAHIAVFTPDGINPELIGKVAGAHINVFEPALLEGHLQIAAPEFRNTDPFDDGFHIPFTS